VYYKRKSISILAKHFIIFLFYYYDDSGVKVCLHAVIINTLT